MNELTLKENLKIEDMIYKVRGKQVIFDFEIPVIKWYVIFK